MSMQVRELRRTIELSTVKNPNVPNDKGHFEPTYSSIFGFQLSLYGYYLREYSFTMVPTTDPFAQHFDSITGLVSETTLKGLVRARAIVDAQARIAPVSLKTFVDMLTSNEGQYGSLFTAAIAELGAYYALKYFSSEAPEFDLVIDGKKARANGNSFAAMLSDHAPEMANLYARGNINTFHVYVPEKAPKTQDQEQDQDQEQAKYGVVAKEDMEEEGMPELLPIDDAVIAASLSEG